MRSYAMRKNDGKALDKTLTSKISSAPQPSNSDLLRMFDNVRSTPVNLPESMENRMRERFGVSFAGLKVHKDESLKMTGYDGYARGNEIHIDAEKYDPSSADGQNLLIHEASHVVQQGAGLARGTGVLENASLEAQADSGMISATSQFTMPVSASGPVQGKKSKLTDAEKQAIRDHGDELAEYGIEGEEMQDAYVKALSGNYKPEALGNMSGRTLSHLLRHNTSETSEGDRGFNAAVRGINGQTDTAGFMDAQMANGGEMNPLRRAYMQKKMDHLRKKADPTSRAKADKLEEIERAANLRVWQNTLSKQVAGGGVTEQQATGQNAANMSTMKMMLMMQMGGGIKISGQGDDHMHTGTMADILSHGGRTSILMPKTTGERTSDDLDASLFGATDEQKRARGVSTRAFATHHTKQTDAGTTGARESKGKMAAIKSLFSGTEKHFGINMGMGGLGKKGLDGSRVSQDGRHGHLYVGRQISTATKGGVLNVGLETSSAGKKSSTGKVHDARALSGQYSSTMGRKVDKVGKETGGREVDLRGLNYDDIMSDMGKFETYMRGLNPEQYNEQVGHLLSGDPERRQALMARIRAME